MREEILKGLKDTALSIFGGTAAYMVLVNFVF